MQKISYKKNIQNIYDNNSLSALILAAKCVKYRWINIRLCLSGSDKLVGKVVFRLLSVIFMLKCAYNNKVF